jgi:hypothetical protein
MEIRQGLRKHYTAEMSTQRTGIFCVVFVKDSAETCLLSRCVSTTIHPGCTLPAFGRYVTINLEVLNMELSMQSESHHTQYAVKNSRQLFFTRYFCIFCQHKTIRPKVG